MIPLRLIGAVCGGALAILQPVQAQSEGGSLSSLAVFRLLSERLGSDVASLLSPGDSATVVIFIEPKETAWIVEEGMLTGLSKRGFVVRESPKAMVAVDCAMEEMVVRYENIRQTSLFGARVVDRTVVMRMHAKVVRQQEGEIIIRKDLEQQRTDTVCVADVAKLENPGIPVTRGELPPEGFFTTFLEPMIVAATIGIAIFLLFTVRS